MARITPSGSARGLARRSESAGFTYLGLLFVVAIMGLAMALAAQVWETNIRREKERELLFVGKQLRQAIGNYYAEMPDGVKRYPRRLEDLLQDNRFPGVKRHLRKLYRDPVTGGDEWGLVLSDEGGIQGVYSLSSRTPLKRTGFDTADMGFENKLRYSEWQFVHIPSPSAKAESGDDGQLLLSVSPGR
jgi:type II secretory pathway pseudopilin PulG